MFLASHWTSGSEGFSLPLVLLAITPYVILGLVGLWLLRRLRSGDGTR